MVWRGRERDPTLDPAASDVLPPTRPLETRAWPLPLVTAPVLKRGVKLIAIMLLPLQRSRPWP